MSAAAQMEMQDLVPTVRWVAWRNEERDGRLTKIPYSSGRRQAKSNDCSTWRTHDEAALIAKQIVNGDGGGVGVMLGELGNFWLIGFDFDTCRDPETGVIENWAKEILERLSTYKEISPSGTGAKAFALVRAADISELRRLMGTDHGRLWKRDNDKEHPPAIELHISNRYFAVTWNALDSATELRLLDIDTLRWLITVAAPAFVGKSAQTDGGKKPSPGDQSRSGAAFRLAREMKQDGKTFEGFVAAAYTNPKTAEWAREKGEANGQRQLRRAWERAPSVSSKPQIQYVRGRLDTLASEAEDRLIEAGLPIFQRNKSLVHPYAWEVPAAHGRTTVITGLNDLCVAGMLDRFCRVGDWVKYDARVGGLVACDPPQLVASVLLSRAGEWRFPVIAGIITTPTLRPDGSLLYAPGYDAATQLYLEPDPNLRMPCIRERPTKQDAERALTLLTDLLVGFPFMDRPSLSVGLSALITPVVRGMFPVVPLHALTAPAAGTGKSYLVDTASAIALGQICPVASAGRTEEETEKRLIGLLIKGSPIFSIDNVNGELGGDLLCQVIEHPRVTIRPLGTTDVLDIEIRTTPFATGNNLRLRGDMTRRVLRGGLDAQMERPETRDFPFDPVQRVLEDRGKYVAACITIVRAYFTSGERLNLSPLQSFMPWSQGVREALVWLGCADPVTTTERAREEDPEKATLLGMLTAWHAYYGTAPATVAEAVRIVTEALPKGDEAELKLRENLRTAITEIAGIRNGGVDNRRLGNYISSVQGTIAGGLRFVKDGSCGGSTSWKVVESR